MARRGVIPLIAVGVTVGLLLVACSASSPAASVRDAQPSPPVQGSGPLGQGGAGQGSPGAATPLSGVVPISGSVPSTAGDTITVTTQKGDTMVKVTGARIQQTVEGTTADLTAGQTVIVTGQQASSGGAFTASSVEISPANGAGQPGFPGQGPAQGLGQGQGLGLAQGQAPLRGQTEPGQRMAGSVVSLEGDALVVKSQQGDATSVEVTGARIQKSVGGTVSDLVAGKSVTAIRQQGADGTAAAINILIRAADLPSR